MKNPNRVLVLAFCFTALSAFAKEGGNGSHGGDSTAGAFYGVAKRTLTALERECRVGFDHQFEGDVCEQALPKFRKLVPIVEVKSRPKVFADDGLERDAVNDGVRKIRVGRIRWIQGNKDRINPGNRIRLVTHEYLIIAGLEKSDRYWISENVLSFLMRRNQDVFAISGIDRGVKPGVGEVIGQLLQSAELERFIETTLVPPRFHFGDGGYHFLSIEAEAFQEGFEKNFQAEPETIGLTKANPNSEIEYEVYRFKLKYRQPFTGEVVGIDASLIRNPFSSRFKFALSRP